MDGSFAREARTRTQTFAADLLRRVQTANRRRLALMVIPPVLLAIIGAVWLMMAAGTVSTDNATVAAARAPISASVRGRVIEVLVHENQQVHAGDVLFRLDPDDLQIAVSDAEAKLAGARLQVSALRAAYGQAVADRRAAQAQGAHASAELRRQRNLFEAGVISQQDLDRAATDAEVQARQASAAGQAEATALANLGGSATMNTERHPLVLQAQAALARARSDLNDTAVRAPVDGVVARVSQMQVGVYVQPAQTVFYLISGAPWIDAAFKEDQLAKLRPGQNVRIRIDAYPGRTFAGHVDSFSPGTGSSFAVLPAENATGNWVRVVQRLNVRIAFDEVPENAALAIGLSARVAIDTKHTPETRPAPETAVAQGRGS